MGGLLVQNTSFALASGVYTILSILAISYSIFAKLYNISCFFYLLLSRGYTCDVLLEIETGHDKK